MIVVDWYVDLDVSCEVGGDGRSWFWKVEGRHELESVVKGQALYIVARQT
jgi:hypothetical protein